MTEKSNEFEMLQEPLIVRADASPEFDPSASDLPEASSYPREDDPSNSLASVRQVHGAMWAGGITGLMVGGPIGAGLGVWGGHHFSKKDQGNVGKFVRKAGDFTSKLGSSIKREWNEAKEDYNY